MVAGKRKGIDESEGFGNLPKLGDRDRPVERHHGGRRERQQVIVERHDLSPVRLLGALRVAVHGVDRRLQLVGAGAIHAQAQAHERLPLGHE